MDKQHIEALLSPLPPEQRQRVEEVALLLAKEVVRSSLGDTMLGPLEELFEELFEELSSPAPPPSEGATTERYERRALIGRGGTGVVYRVYDRKVFRHVAMKVLRPNLVPEINDTFDKEARLSALLDNIPGIVAMTDYGQLEDGRPYLIMEEVIGDTFSDRIRAFHHPGGQSGASRRDQLLTLLRQFVRV